MGKPLSTTLVVAFGGLAGTFASGGVSSAQPDMSSLVNTTCSYSQVVAALNAQSRDVASQFNTQPLAQSMLRTFLASPLDQREQMVKAHSAHWDQQFTGSLVQVAGVCNDY